MIEDDFHKAVIQRIANSVYFSTAPAVLVVSEEEPDDGAEDGDPGEETISKTVDPAAKIADALATSGLVIEVLYPDWKRDQNEKITFEGVIHILENREMNRRSTTGARRRGRNAARVVCNLLESHQLAVDEVALEWASRVRVTGRDFLGAVDGQGLWEVRYESNALFEVLPDEVSTP